MSQSQTRQNIITRDDALTVVKSLLKGENNRFELAQFEKYNTHAKLRSQHYKGYFVVCHANTMRSAGWLLCRYAQNGVYTVEKGLFNFETLQGATTRLLRHTKSHENGPSNSRIRLQLPRAARTQFALAAAYVVAIDNRPSSFCQQQQGMAHFTKPYLSLDNQFQSTKKLIQNLIYQAK